ncbi:MAG: hypothetical protein QGG75_03585 [Alphaproteobacteria bacterium]|jgi:hypothetical protein|nr:hypothetical protein [Alphaproteobacteria bacterium]
MNTPEPLTEQNVLHNQMINADESDLATLRDIVWKLRKLDRKLGNDFSTRMSLQIGLMAIGEREEADSLTESLLGLCPKQNPIDIAMFAGSLAGLLRLDEAHLVIRRLFESSGRRVMPYLIGAATHCAALEGDADWMAELAEMTSDESNSSASEILEVLNVAELVDHFAPHQNIVNQIMRSHQCGSKIARCLREKGDEALSVIRYVPSSRAKRTELQTEIRLALSAYYKSVGLDPSICLSHFSTAILPHPVAITEQDGVAA